jgi:hypothetical protein
VAHPKHAEVRARFRGCCGYCGISEEDAGGELCVDHYTPVTAGGDDSDENLIYSCFRCNQFKSDFQPTDADRVQGFRVLHPLRDECALHIRLNESTASLEPLTATGRFHIALLHLNRPSLVAYRLRRRHEELLCARRELLEDEVRELRAIISAQETYIARLRELLAGQGPVE